MISTSIIPKGFVPSVECCDWLANESIRLLRKSSEALRENHDMNAYDLLSFWHSLLYKAMYEAWNARDKYYKAEAKRLEEKRKDWTWE